MGVIRLRKGQKGQQYASKEDKKRVEEAKRKREKRLKDPVFVKKEKKERRKAERRIAVTREPIKAEKKSPRQQALEKHPKLTRGLETSAVVLTTIAAGMATYGLTTIPTATVLGTRVGSILHTASIHHWSKATGMLVAKKGITLSRSPILEKAARVGSTGVDKLFKAGVRIAVNQKTTALTTSELSKSFSGRTLAIFGAWASSVFLGKWAQAEAPEAITIPLRDALRQAKETGDWSIYDEYHESAEEISNMSMWETILSYSPISALPGILNKMKGVKEGIALIDAIAEKTKEEEAKKELEEPEPTFAEQREQADIEARERKLKYRKEDEEYYAQFRKD